MTKRKKNTLSGLLVRHAMRRQTVSLPRKAGIERAIIAMVKYKINALLTTDEDHQPVGVISKTDIMGAYYAELPLDSPVEHIMSSPPLFCGPEDSLEATLETMRTHRVYRLYVRQDDSDPVTGILAYPDIVGLLYRYCHSCDFAKSSCNRKKESDDTMDRYSVKEVMTPSVESVQKDETINQVVETLSAYRFGAVLVNDADGAPCGVISKTDLVLAYKHGLSPETKAEAIMTSPVRTCDEDQLLETAIKEMIFGDVQRLFIHRGDSDHVVGVLSLSDTARIRSGSCHACVSSRIKLEDQD